MTTCESRIAVPCNAVSYNAVSYNAGTLTPHTRAITPIKPRGTERAAATALPIRGLAEGCDLCVVSVENSDLP